MKMLFLLSSLRGIAQQGVVACARQLTQPLQHTACFSSIEKDSSRPKRVSGYNLFYKEEYSKCKEQGIALPEASKLISQKYKDLTAQQLEAYKLKADELSGRAYRPEPQPKRAPTAYNNFFKEKLRGIRTGNPSSPLSQSEAMKEVGTMWRGMSERDKELYK